VQQSGGKLKLVQSRVAGNVQVKGGGTFAIGPVQPSAANLEIQNLANGTGTKQSAGPP
jgi:hypothetical protein